MEQQTIYIAEYCRSHNIDRSFIDSLYREGLIAFSAAEDTISDDELERLEIFTRLHHELGINPAGIDAISHLLDRMRELQMELHRLRSRLSLYEKP